MFDPIHRWTRARPQWTLLLVVAAALAPFLGKPFNLDDPLFLWAAKQIHAHPGDPYGFNVNWYGVMEPMWSVTQNPPLACYYIALVAAVFGWSEPALHFAFLLPAIAVILGTYRLAQKCCRQPLLAAAATLLAPAFLVSSTTVMCDVLMLAFWVWAVNFWMAGMAENNFRRLAVAGLLIALAALTKYYGACLIPLLLVYGLVEKRGIGGWAVCLLIPLAVLGVYEWITHALYGHALLSGATAYAKNVQDFFGFSKMASGLTALAFTGGCFAIAVFLAPLVWRTRTLVIFAAGAVLIAAGMLVTGMPSIHYPWLEGTRLVFVELQAAFWMFGGICVLALAAADLRERRDARAWLLALWLLGTFAFAAFINWTVNARTLLPMAPAVGILLARRLEKAPSAGGGKARSIGMVIGLTAGGMVALLVTRADFELAIAARKSAREVCGEYDPAHHPMWFQGHWGFQYYMQAAGATALDLKHPEAKPGDLLAVPLNNSGLSLPDEGTAARRETVSVPGPPGLTTWSGGAGAGFYAATRGPLPFAFGHVPPEKVFVYELTAAPPAPPAKN